MNRLRFELKTRPSPVERPDKEVCGICKRQISRYTCPTCNLPYCSLTCFRSEVHSECSETFYKKEIQNDIQTAPAKSTEERRKMLEMLKRFEEGNVQIFDDTLEEDDDDLAHKLEGINLDEAETDAIWKILSPSQRDTFLKAIRDPSSELAQQLLSSAELEKGRRKPWWESRSIDIDPPAEDSEEFGTIPQMMSILQGLEAVHGSSRPLIYNILALCLTYAYVTRRLSVSPLSSLNSTDPDRIVAKDLISRIAPFLTDRKSTVLFTSVDSITTDVWSRLDALSDPPSREFFALLLADAALLLRPQHVSVIADAELQSHPSRIALLAISDIVALFMKSKHIVHKLRFYAAHLRDQNIDVVRLVAEEARNSGVAMQTQS